MSSISIAYTLSYTHPANGEASNGDDGAHLEVLKWARENGCKWDSWTCSNAAEGGHLDVLQWARENDCPWDRSTSFLCSLISNTGALIDGLSTSNGGPACTGP